MAASGSGGSLMNAPGGGGDAGGSLRSSRQAYLSYGNSTSEKTTGHSLSACVERPVLRTTWIILDTTCVENVLARTGHTANRLTIEWRRGEIKKRNPVLFTKDLTPI